LSLPAIHAVQESRQMKPGRLRPLLLCGYGIGSLGTGILSSVPSLLLLYFMTEALGITPALAGLGIFIPKIWDMVFDPIMGTISDRTKTRWGHRRPYLLIGGILAALSFGLLFHVPRFEASRSNFVYVILVFWASTTFYSVFSVPYIAMPAELSDESNERTIIVSYRMGFALAGILLGSALGPILVTSFGGGRRGYSAMGVVLGLFSAFAMLLTFLTSRHLSLRPRLETNLQLWDQTARALRNRPFFALWATYIVQMAAISCIFASLPYFVVYVLGNSENAVGKLLLAMFLAAIAFMPFWVWVSGRIGKRYALIASIAMYALAALALALDGRKPSVWVITGQFVLMGIAFAGLQLMPFSMLTDAINLDFSNTGMRREGMFTGLWIAGEKAGLALGPLIAGSLFSAFGFRLADADATVHPSGVLLGIRMGSSIVPAALLAMSMIMALKYPVHRS
jgi:glycoside/pentoside/hexuronide:cation symporter, GPH family